MTLTAIVTGGGRGIGAATASLLARHGINVAICSRTADEINGVATSLTPNQSGIIGSVCDVRSTSQVDLFVKSVLDRFGGVDILVNNAGKAYVKPLTETSEADWDETIDTNLKGPFLFTKAVLPAMIKSGRGAIINVSSSAGKIGFANLSAYCASKFGLIGLTESTAWEVAGFDIRVMSICPGEVATEMQKLADADYFEKNQEQMSTAGQVASLIVEMALDPRYTNGQTVDI